MTRAADNGLRPLVRAGLVKAGAIVTPLETGGVTSGVPDLHWAWPATRTAGWLELKATDGRQRGLDLRPHQVAWLRRHAAAGVRCAVAAWVTDPEQERLMVLVGASATALVADWRVAALAGALVLELPGAPRRWDWGRLLGALSS